MPSSPSTLREALPALAAGAYLNAGTNGPMPRAAAEAMREELERQFAEPRIGASAFERVFATRDAARAGAARALGGRPADVALTSSTTQGIGLVIAGLSFSAGDEALTTTEEHQGLLGPLDQAARRFGLVVRAVPADELVAAIGPRTRLVGVSHVLWTTGRVLPLPEIAARAHDAGAAVLVDGAQSAGAIAVDVEASGADFYAISGQKWLLGPQGSGALWVHERWRERLQPAMPGYLTYREGRVGDLREDASRFDAGTIDPVTLAGFAAALAWVEGLEGGRAEWLRRGAEATAAALGTLRGAGVEVVEPPAERSGLVAVALPEGVESADVVAALGERRILVRAIPGTRYLRLSVGPWTTEEEVEAAAAALVDVVPGR